MKKILLIILSCSLAIGLVIGICFIFTPKPIYATNINILTNSIEMQVDDELYIDNNYFTVEPANYNQRPVFSCTNENIATIDVFTGKVVAKQVGNCNIVITVKVSETQTINKRIYLSVVERKVYPNSVVLNVDNLEMYINQSLKLNTYILGNTNVLPQVSTVNGCVEYSFATDTVLATKVGSDILTITYTLSNGQVESFSITILVKEKLIVNQNKTISFLNDKLVPLYYDTQSSKEDCLIDISVNDVVEVVEHEYKQIIIKPLKIGFCVIIITTPNSIYTFNITVE